MTGKKLLSKPSSSLTLTTVDWSSSSSLFFSSFSDDDQDVECRDIEVECENQERGRTKKCRPLSSFLTRELSNQDEDDEVNSGAGNKSYEKTMVVLTAGCCGPATKVMHKISPFWRKCIAVLAVLGLVGAAIGVTVEKCRNNGKDNTSSFVSNAISNGHSNVFAGSGNNVGGIPEAPVQDPEAVPSLAPAVVADEAQLAASETSGSAKKVSIRDAPTRSPSNKAIWPPLPTIQAPSPVANPPTSSPSTFVPPPVDFPSPTISPPSTPVVANPPTPSPSSFVPPPVPFPTISPVSVQDIPTDSPLSQVAQPPTTYPVSTSPPSSLMVPSPQGESVVLYTNESLQPGEFRSSPNNQYQVGLTDAGDLVLMRQQDNSIIWSTATNSGQNSRLFMQTDGNLLLRNGAGTSMWTTETHGYPGARLVVTDAGQVAVKTAESESATALWLDGIPRGGQYTPSFNSASNDLVFPIRGTFYYPWYPQTWYINNHKAHYDSTLGMYSSSDPEVASAHIQAMDYAHVDLSIASWWGPDTNLDKARLTMLMDETVALNSPLKWSVYYEDERDLNPTVDELISDLDYLKKWFTWHQAWGYVGGLPVIFVYNEAGCDVADRWVAAGRGEWHVVLKIFPGFEDCASQPGDWHQYGVGMEDGTIQNEGYSFVLAPGFWRADTNTPLVPRVGKETWCNNAQRMVASGEPYQLIVTFNEAGEGTMIEPSPEWESDSGYGYYLDCLNLYY